MYEPLKDALLRLMRVPPEPLDPMGDVRQLRVFRAAPGFFRYIKVGWWIVQILLLLLVVFVTVVLVVAGRQGGNAALLCALAAILFIAFFIAEALISYFLLRLNFEMRWYKVTDRSLRIREGIWNVHEMTLTFANIQNINITQGPLERFFGISNVRVETAGGGGAQARGPHGEQLGPNLHLGVFRGVDNAEEIRDLMMERLRRLRDTGLGDFDEKHLAGLPAVISATHDSDELLQLFTALRDEARALRIAAQGRSAL